VAALAAGAEFATGVEAAGKALLDSVAPEDVAGATGAGAAKLDGRVTAATGGCALIGSGFGALVGAVPGSEESACAGAVFAAGVDEE
jgi:hypothetical protein